MKSLIIFAVLKFIQQFLIFPFIQQSVKIFLFIFCCNNAFSPFRNIIEIYRIYLHSAHLVWVHKHLNTNSPPIDFLNRATDALNIQGDLEASAQVLRFHLIYQVIVADRLH